MRTPRDTTEHLAHMGADTLLLFAAGELPAADAERVSAHVTTCAACREQAARLRACESAVLASADEAAADSTHDNQRRRALVRRMAAIASERRTSHWTVRRGALTTAAVVLLGVAAWQWVPAAPWRGGDAPNANLVRPSVRALPIRSITPGATVTLAAEDLCRQEPREPLPVPEHVRADILRQYGMEELADHEYELDYLITPALGGAPDPRNLWPEPYHAPVWNARVKDELEDLLPQLVCEGKVDLQTAQQEIAADWIAAYKKYFRTDRPLRRS